MRLRNDGIDSIAPVNAERDILAALPGIWTRSRTPAVSIALFCFINQARNVARDAARALTKLSIARFSRRMNFTNSAKTVELVTPSNRVGCHDGSSVSVRWNQPKNGNWHVRVWLRLVHFHGHDARSLRL
jgi:hypothetical protein